MTYPSHSFIYIQVKLISNTNQAPINYSIHNVIKLITISALLHSNPINTIFRIDNNFHHLLYWIHASIFKRCTHSFDENPLRIKLSGYYYVQNPTSEWPDFFCLEEKYPYADLNSSFSSYRLCDCFYHFIDFHPLRNLTILKHFVRFFLSSIKL